jgi:LmbE family N-acetylglucosaminyl deacetylase
MNLDSDNDSKKEITNAGSKSKPVFIICAHSDDEILGPGGTIAKYSKEGIDVHTFIMSYGEMSHPWMIENHTIKTRVKEAQNADKVIGGKSVTFLGLREGNFIKQAKEKKIMSRLRKRIMELNPSKILTHSLNDPLPDHRAVLEIVKKTISKLKKKPDVYSFAIWNPISIKKRNRPKLIVDISQTYHLKVKALMCFKSQKLSIYQLLPSVTIQNFLAGIHNGKRFVETFYKVDLDDD